MNLNTLHHYLTRLSPSEQRYQSGYPFDGWEHLEKTTVQGRSVMIMKPDMQLLHRDAIGVNPLTCGLDAASGLPTLSLKRNSRFNPVPEHIHSHIEINYVYSGVCPQTINGRPVVLQKDQVLLIDTNCPHSIGCLNEQDIMISILLQKDYLRNNIFSQFSQDSILSHFFVNAINEKTRHDHFLLFHSEDNRRVPLFFRELFCECYDPSINSADIIMHLFYTIMAELINVHENDMAREKKFSENVPIVQMIRYIERSFRTCTQTSVAEFFHISPNYVSTLLKKYTGMTYIRMTQELKLKYAANLLKHTDIPITDIANDAGYENVSFFYQKFHACFHCSPKEYRAREKAAAQ